MQRSLLDRGTELLETILARDDGCLLVRLSHEAGVDEGGEPRATNRPELVNRRGLFDSVLVGLDGGVVVRVVLRLGHCC